MIRVAKRIAVIALPLAVIVAGPAWAKPHRVVGTTEIAIQSIYVGQKDRLSVSGVLRSDVRYCRRLQPVYLMRIRSGNDEYVDVALTSVFRAAWAARTGRGAVEEGARFYAKTQRSVSETLTVTRHGRSHRRTIVCKGDRVPVALPPTPTATG